MAEGFTWTELAQPAYENANNLMHLMGWPFNDEGQTWGVLGQPVEIAHEPGHGVQAFLHIIMVLIVVSAMAAAVYPKIKDKHAALVPDERLSLRTFFELFVGAVYGTMKDIMGDKAAKYFLPLIGTCAFLILFSNALGLVPGFLPPTSSFNVTLACAVVIFFATHIFGVKEHGAAYFKHFFGPIIKWYALPLMLLMLGIEVISHVVRPISLAIRLMANMFADHLVLGVFFGLIPILVPVPILLLGSLVVVVQTLVFCILSTVYIAMAIEHSEDH